MDRKTFVAAPVGAGVPMTDPIAAAKAAPGKFAGPASADVGAISRRWSASSR